jgi:hypothetical protein
VRALVADAAALVVVDNYETIADVEKKRIEAWFKAARCSALFTSRHRISETVFVQVSAMSSEEAEEFLSKVEAARLFREALSIFERLRSPYAEIARRNLARVEDKSS